MVVRPELEAMGILSSSGTTLVKLVSVSSPHHFLMLLLKAGNEASGQVSVIRNLIMNVTILGKE